ncbi:MAG: hypothetical protein EOO28_27265 [Comamonadaceae bacterium]|nr:MAG: hypothetical protein EOO28_27265 [Comamonadaceae bacterium]
MGFPVKGDEGRRAATRINPHFAIAYKNLQAFAARPRVGRDIALPQAQHRFGMQVRAGLPASSSRQLPASGSRKSEPEQDGRLRPRAKHLEVNNRGRRIFPTYATRRISGSGDGAQNPFIAEKKPHAA